MQSSASLCRLCTNKIRSAPVRISPKTAACPKATIIQRHFGIQVFGFEPDVDALVCPNCWTTTEQFHQLYVTVQQHETALKQSLSDVVPSSTSIKLEDSKLSSSPVASYANPFESESLFVECKVEIQDDDTGRDEDAFDRSSSSSSSPTFPDADDDVSASVAAKRRKKSKTTATPRRKKATATSPSKPRAAAKTGSAAGAAGTVPKRTMTRWSPEEIAEQDIKVRGFFQMYCDMCDEQFSVLRDAIVHYRSVHERPGYLKCCGKKFFNRTLVLDHIQQHADPNAFHCARCKRSYCSQAALSLHLASHDELNPKQHKCIVCGMDYVKSFQLSSHQRQLHVVRTEKSFGCDICGKFFFTKFHLSAHMHAMHMAKHICDICAQTFKTKSRLNEHHRRVHIGEVKPKVQCGICGVWLSDGSGLRKHVERHNQVAVACHLCGKLAPNQFALASHMRYVHSEDKFPCTVCDKSFKRAIGLREHMAAHTGVDLYTCSYCPRTFKSNSNMFAHRKKSHPIEWCRDRKQCKAS